MNIIERISFDNITNIDLLKQYRQNLIAGKLKIYDLFNILNNEEKKEIVEITLPTNHKKLTKTLDFMIPIQIDKNGNFKRIQSFDKQNYWEPLYKIAHQIGKDHKLEIKSPKINTKEKIISLQKTESTPKNA